MSAAMDTVTEHETRLRCDQWWAWDHPQKYDDHRMLQQVQWVKRAMMSCTRSCDNRTRFDTRRSAKFDESFWYIWDACR